MSVKSYDEWVAVGCRAQDPQSSPRQGVMVPDTDGRITPQELQAIREYLGLTGEALAGMLRVNPRTVRAWEAGRGPIPRGVGPEIDEAVRLTDATVLAVARAAPAATTVVVRTDDDLRRLWPEAPSWATARWWRHILVRAAAVSHAAADESPSR